VSAAERASPVVILRGRWVILSTLAEISMDVKVLLAGHHRRATRRSPDGHRRPVG
jgi:hypothetical protein